MNGRFATLDAAQPRASAVSIRQGVFEAVGSDAEITRLVDAETRVIDLAKRTVVPGLNDSHTHVIRGGLYYDMELRWEGVPSVTDALRMLKDQAERTPAPHTPVFILHLYDRALLNQAALRALGITKDTANPPGGRGQQGPPRQPLGPAARGAERPDPVFDAGEGTGAAVRRSAALVAPLSARAESSRRHERDRRRRRRRAAAHERGRREPRVVGRRLRELPAAAPRAETCDQTIAIVQEHGGAYGMGVDYAYTLVHKANRRGSFTGTTLPPKAAS